MKQFLTRVKHAWEGIQSAFSSETNFRIQVIAAVIVITVLYVTDTSLIWWAVILLCIGCVLAAEMFNTALERLVDRIHPETHPSIKLVKDCAAGAVLILSISSVGVAVTYVLKLLR